MREAISINKKVAKWGSRKMSTRVLASPRQGAGEIRGPSKRIGFHQTSLGKNAKSEYIKNLRVQGATSKAKKAVEKIRAIRFRQTTVAGNMSKDPKINWSIKHIKKDRKRIKIGTLNGKGLNEKEPG